MGSKCNASERLGVLAPERATSSLLNPKLKRDPVGSYFRPRTLSVARSVSRTPRAFSGRRHCCAPREQKNPTPWNGLLGRLALGISFGGVETMPRAYLHLDPLSFFFLFFFFLLFSFLISFSFIYFHLLSFSFIFLHFLSFSFFFLFLFLVGCSKSDFFWVSISLRFLLTVLM